MFECLHHDEIDRCVQYLKEESYDKGDKIVVKGSCTWSKMDMTWWCSAKAKLESTKPWWKAFGNLNRLSSDVFEMNKDDQELDKNKGEADNEQVQVHVSSIIIYWYDLETKVEYQS